MQRLFLPLLLFLSLLSCQSKESAQEANIFGNLYVRYLQDGGQLKAQASFFEGDSAHLATPKSIVGGVSFQGSGMESRNIQDKMIRYQYELYTTYPQQFSFQVQDDQGKAQVFQLEMPPVNNFSLPDTINISAGASVSIEPAPASAKEELALLFSDENGKAFLVEIPPPISQNILLSPTQLSRLSPGLYQLYLVKKQKSFIHTGVYRVSCELEFYTGVKEVWVNKG